MAIVLAFISGQVAFSLKSGKFATVEDIKGIQVIKQELQEILPPVFRIDIKQDYPDLEYIKLLTPKVNYKGHLSKRMRLFSAPCRAPGFKKRMTLMRLIKPTIWEDFRCGYLEKLPPQFFETFPLMHENGLSYAYLAFLQGPLKFKSYNWIQSHIRFFHLTEINDLPINLPTLQNFLVHIKKKELYYVLNNQKSFFTEDFYVIRKDSLNYNVYTIDMASNFIRRNGYKIQNKFNPNKCFYQDGLVCWKRRPNSLVEFLSQTLILQFIAAIAILILTAVILYRKIKKQKIEEERKRHGLRVLTHELRTPIAGLLLHIEGITRHTDDLDPKVLEYFMRIESDVYRLKHLAEKSKGYLQSDSSSIIKFNKVHITSVKEFVEDTIIEFTGINDHLDIQLKTDEDFETYFDPYWVKICLSNLIDNGIRYGKAPIQITLSKTEQCFKVEVSDQGSTSYPNLKSLVSSQTEESQGMGIGLKIVINTLKEMGGDLLFTNSPTKFTIKIPLSESADDNKNTTCRR